MATAKENKWDVQKDYLKLKVEEGGKPVKKLGDFDAAVVDALRLYKPLTMLYHTTLESTPLAVEKTILKDLEEYLKEMYSASA